MDFTGYNIPALMGGFNICMLGFVNVCVKIMVTIIKTIIFLFKPGGHTILNLVFNKALTFLGSNFNIWSLGISSIKKHKKYAPGPLMSPQSRPTFDEFPV